METTNLKAIPDFDGYLINENGQVFSLKNDAANQFSNGMHELKQLKRKYGGPVVSLTRNGNVYQKKVTRLVANIFNRKKIFENKPNEKWKKTKFSCIQISNFGRIRKRGDYYDDSDMTYCKYKELQTSDNGHGYKAININGKQQYVHRLVATAFIPNLNDLPAVNHKDENKSNNTVDNLEWCTAKYNVNYGTYKKRASWSKSKPVIGFGKTKVAILKHADNAIRNNIKGISRSSRKMKWRFLKFDFNGLKKLKLTNVEELEKQNEK